MARKSKQFCKQGHDKFVTGIGDEGRCLECRRQKSKARPKREETPEQKEKRAERQRQYRKNNPQKHRDYDKKYYWEDPDKFRAKTKRYRNKHKDDPKKPTPPHRLQWLKDYRVRNRERDIAYRASRKHIQDAYNKDYYVANREDLMQASLDYYWNNREGVSKRAKQRREENPEKARAQAKAQRHNRRNAIGTLTADVLERIWREGDGICAYCLTDVSPFPEDPNHWRLEHCIPISRGGTHFIDNLVVSCQRCNNRKYKKTSLEFYLKWPKVTKRYDFFIEETLCEKDQKKLKAIHKKYKEVKDE